MTLYPNQFAMSEVKGKLDMAFNYNTIPCVVYASEATALVAGQAVKLVPTAQVARPIVTACTSNDDVVFGFVNFTLKDISYAAGSAVEISIKGNVMYMQSNAAVTQGSQVMLVISGTKVANATSTHTVVGWAWDGADAADELIRIFIESPIQLWQAPSSIALTDGYIIVGNGSNLGAGVAMTGDITITDAGVTAVGAGKILEAMLQVPTANVLGAKRIARALFDPTNTAGHRTVAAHTLGVTLPANAVITRSWYDVPTAFTSTGSTATIAFSCQTANNILSAAVISSAGTQALHEGVSDGTVANMKKLTTGGLITATVAAEALLGGTAVIFVEYVVTNVNV